MVLADYYSRDLDTTDYGISHDAFDAISKVWGPFTIDAFASDSNRRVKRFFSRLYSQVAEGVDAFSQSWDGEHLWACPPVSLVGKALKHLVASENASAVFCMPKWETATFWLLLVPDGRHFANCVKNHVEFAPKYFSGQTVKSKMFRGVPRWDTLCVFVDSNSSKPFEPHYAKDFCLLHGCDRCA